MSGFLLVSPVNPRYVPQGETIPCFWPVFLLGFPKKTNSQPLTFGLPANQVSQLKSVWGRLSSVFPHTTRGTRRARRSRRPARGSLQPRRQRKLAFQARRRRQQEEARRDSGTISTAGGAGCRWFFFFIFLLPKVFQNFGFSSTTGSVVSREPTLVSICCPCFSKIKSKFWWPNPH